MRKISYHLFTGKNNEKYVFDFNKIVPIHINENMYSVLLKLEKEAAEGMINEIKIRENLGAYPELINIIDEGLLFTDNADKKEESIQEQYCFSFAPIYACNLSCKYCFSNRKKEVKYMPIDIIEKTLLFFFETFKFTNYRIDFVSGGEPLFDKQHFKACINRINEVNAKYNKKCVYWLVTNSINLDEDILDFLDANNFQMGISIDGPQEVHNHCRKTIEGKDTYLDVIKQIRMIINNARISRRIKNIWALSVITSKTKSLDAIIEHHNQEKIKNMQMKVVRTNNRNYKPDYIYLKNLYSNLLDYLKLLLGENNIEKFCSIMNMNDYFGKFFCRIMLHISENRRCNAGKSRFSISPEGQIFACDSFVGIDEFCLGSIFEGFNDQYLIFQSHEVNKCNPCNKCWAKKVCGGDCMHNSYKTNKNIAVPDPDICNLNLFLIEQIIELILTMASEYPEFSKRVYSIILQRFLLSEV